MGWAFNETKNSGGIEIIISYWKRFGVGRYDRPSLNRRKEDPSLSRVSIHFPQLTDMVATGPITEDPTGNFSKVQINKLTTPPTGF